MGRGEGVGAREADRPPFFSPPSSLPHALLLPQNLLAIKGISDTKVEKILEACKKLKPVGFVTGNEGEVFGGRRWRRRTSRPPLTLFFPPCPTCRRAAIVASKTRMRITTGSKELDRILGGGIETGR